MNFGVVIECMIDFLSQYSIVLCCGVSNVLRMGSHAQGIIEI